MAPRKSRRTALAATGTLLEVASKNNHDKLSSADSLHAPPPPPPPVAHLLKIPQEDGPGAPLSASSPDPTSQTQTETKATVEPSNEEAAPASTGKRKPSWNALRRYYSEANSFPDYGTRRSAMGAERLRLLNQAGGPVNTLTGNGRKRELPESPSASKQAMGKRQKRDMEGKTSPSRLMYQKSPSKPSLSRSRTRGNEPNTDHHAHRFKAHTETNGLANAHNPPPTNISSDIISGRRGPKRRHSDTNTTSVEVHIKRSRAPAEIDKIDTSEDELQTNHSTYSTNVRPTNFTRVGLSPRLLRGDITPTKFNRTPVAREACMTIAKAVSGRFIYDAENSAHPHLSLRRSQNRPSLFEAWSSGKPDEAHAWLSIDTNDPMTIKYGGRYLSLRRSVIKSRAPILVLQFVNAQDAAQVARAMGQEENNTRDTMEKILKNFWNQAVSSNRRAPQHHPDPQPPSLSQEERPSAVQNQDCPLESNSKKLRDEMKTRPDNPRHNPRQRRRSSSPARWSGVETRRTRRLSPARKEIPTILERWSDKNTHWEENWKQTLVYPATGRNRASVDKEDILRLDEGEFLNDNLINFYLRYLQVNMEKQRPDLLQRVHIFSTFFFEKLASRKGSINYEGVKNWTSKLDLFSYDYIVVPVNENAHWYLAVMCNIPKLLEPAEYDAPRSNSSTDALGRPRPGTPVMTTVERGVSDISLEDITATRRSSRQVSSGLASSPARALRAPSSPVTPLSGPRAPSRRLDASQPRIVTLDSLGSNHSTTCRALKEYIVEEAKDKKNITLYTVPGGMKARGIPEQNNFCDCGVFVLGYMEEFLKDPDDLIRKILMRESVDWNVNAVELRKKLRELLFTLQTEQSERLVKEREERRHRWRQSKIAARSSSEANDSSSKHAGGSGKETISSESRSLDVGEEPPADTAAVATSTSATPSTPPTPPPTAASASRSPVKDAQEILDTDDEDVDMVKMAPNSDRNQQQQQQQQQSPQRPTTPRIAPAAVKRPPASPPPSSTTISDSEVNETQDSVQLVSTTKVQTTPR